MTRILSMAVLAILLAACGREAPPENSGEEHAIDAPTTAQIVLSDEEIKAAGIRTEALQPAEVHERIALTATIQANQERLAHIAPRVPGRIVTIAVKLGDQVRAGQSLASLDSIELGEAHSGYLQAESQFKLAQADFERAEKLYADQIVPQKDYLRSRAEHEKARASFKAAADKLRLMGVTPARAESAVSVFPIHAPFAGTIIEKQAVLGELAQPDKSLFTVADLSSLWIEANLFEKDLGKVRVGVPAEISVAAYPNEVFKGRLNYISSVMDKESRTVKARVDVSNADGRLKPDMFAAVAVDTASTRQALTVPVSALILVEGQQVVFVQGKAGFEKRAVDLGDALGQRVVVKGGIEAGEMLVVEGAYALKARLLKSKIGDHE